MKKFLYITLFLVALLFSLVFLVKQVEQFASGESQHDKHVLFIDSLIEGNAKLLLELAEKEIKINHSDEVYTSQLQGLESVNFLDESGFEILGGSVWSNELILVKLDLHVGRFRKISYLATPPSELDPKVLFRKGDWYIIDNSKF